jgi:hypothetical protein
MKRKYLIAAGLLCLGTGPAFAFSMPAMAPDMAKAVKDVWADQMAAQKPGIVAAGESWMSDAAPAKAASPAALVEKASFDTMKAGDMLAKSDGAMPADGGFAKADDLTAKPLDLAAAGPSEPVLKADATSSSYPPCSRSSSDDHCIQLYERGVRGQVAEWNRTASGTETAMGGPYEPVATSDATLAGEMGGASMPAGSEYTGVGGPVAASDYPPCSRTVTDRCIQLYERGVGR